MSNQHSEIIPIVSVIIDTYNYSNYIEQCIESVLNQSFSRSKFEIIVVDDGSTDNTKSRIEKYGEQIKYIYKDNGGQSSAFNVGFNCAKGEYLILLDSDDYFHPTKIERIVEEFEQYPDLAVILNSRTIIRDQESYKEEFPNFSNLKLNEQNIEIIKSSSFGTSRTSLRKSYLDKILPLPGDDLTIGADLFINLSILWFGNISCINEHLTYYRVHGNNLYSVSDIDRLPLQISFMQKTLLDVKEAAMKSQCFDEDLFQNLIEPYKIEIRDRKHTYGIYEGSASRKESVLIELQKIKIGWRRWSYMYKFYKSITLPLFYILSPKTVRKIKTYYFRNNMFRFRKFLFKEN